MHICLCMRVPRRRLLPCQALLYAMQVMEDDKPLSHYHVPPGCKVMIALEAAKLGAAPDPDSAYWN